MPDLSTPLIDTVHHKLSDPSLDCKTLAYDKATFSGYSVLPGIPKPVTMSASQSGGTAEPAAMACPSVFYWGKTQYNGCTSYFICVNGSPDPNSLTMCPEGTLYDEASFQCMDPSLVNCSDESSVPVTYSSSAGDSSEVSKLSCPSSFFWGKLQYNGCEGYFECINGVPQDNSLTICEEGTLYNEMLSQCADSSSVSCSQESHIFSEPEEMKEDYITPQFNGPVKESVSTVEDYTIQQFTSPFKGSEVIDFDTEDNVIPITQSPTRYWTLSPTPYPTTVAPTKKPEQVQNLEPTLYPTSRPTERPVNAQTRNPSSPVASSFASMADSFMLFSSSSSSSSKDNMITEKPTAAVYIPPKKGQESLSQMLNDLIENSTTKSKNHGGRLKMNKKKKQKSKGEEQLEQGHKKDEDQDKNKSSKSNKIKMNKVKKKKQGKPKTKVKMNKVKKKKKKLNRGKYSS